MKDPVSKTPITDSIPWGDPRLLKNLYAQYVISLNTSYVIYLLLWVLGAAVVGHAFSKSTSAMEILVLGSFWTLTLLLFTFYIRWLNKKMNSIERFFDVFEKRHDLRREFSHKWFKWLHPSVGSPIE